MASTNHEDNDQIDCIPNYYEKVMEKHCEQCFYKEYIETRYYAFQAGHIVLYKFPNGYSASLLFGGIAYGGCELAIKLNGKICYNTGITNDVVGDLTTFKKRKEYLKKVFELPSPETENPALQKEN